MAPSENATQAYMSFTASVMVVAFIMLIVGLFALVPRGDHTVAHILIASGAGGLALTFIKSGIEYFLEQKREANASRS